MKKYLLPLLLALPLVAQAEIKESKAWLNGHPVTVVTETSPQAPAACQVAFDQALDQQGWHSEIYRSLEADKAFVVVSQRPEDVCCADTVKIVLWKAVVQNGKTVTESRTIALRPNEVNRFLDTELRDVVARFKSAPVLL